MRAVLIGALLASACDIEKLAIPTTEAQLSTHGVLSATALTQVVLLERTQNGTVRSIAPPFDLESPVVTDEGIAETGAILTLTTPEGVDIFAREDYPTRGDNSGRGVYRFALPGASLVRGGTYRLTVLTRKGEVIKGETVVPGGAAALLAQPMTFDRSRDTARIEWPAAVGARSYYVRIDTPFGPRAFFTDSTRVQLPGELRNVDHSTLRRVFVPGFPQSVTVSAVDSNFYDWYRTRSDPLSGRGLLNHVTGGFGFFGSLVRLRFEELQVVAPQTEPVAGSYSVLGPPEVANTSPYRSFVLYVESPSARSDQPDALSGQTHRRVSLGDTGCELCGLLGNAQAGRITLYFLPGWSAADTAEVFTGEIHGDTIVGRYRVAGAIASFLKQH